jgi:putative ABC transport system permease protein
MRLLSVYHIYLAWLKIRHSPWLSLQIVFTTAFGIGAFCATAGALLSLTADPLAGRGDYIFHPQVDPSRLSDREADGNPPMDLTLRDARALYDAAPVGRRFMTSRNWLPVTFESSSNTFARMAITRATTADFFAVLHAPFLFGQGWAPQKDGKADRVVVLSREMNDRLFGGSNSVGRTITIATQPFVIVGVLDTWSITPHFYDLGDGAYSASEDVYIPFETWLDLPQDYGYGPMVCRENDDQNHNPQSDGCTWVQVWVELHGNELEGYRQFLTNYSNDQHSLGRFERTPNIRLYNVPQWMKVNHVLPGSVLLEFWVAVALLLVCIANAAAIQLAKFKFALLEVGIRRALGATRSVIIGQLLIETSMLAIASGVLGAMFGIVGTELLRHSAEKYAAFIKVDYSLLWRAIVVSGVCSAITTLGPALSVSRHTPFYLLRE